MSETKVKKYGTRDQVFAGTALQTKGGLTKDDLFESNGRYVSKRASEAVKIRSPLKSKKTVVTDSDEETPKVVPAAVQKIEEKLAATNLGSGTALDLTPAVKKTRKPKGVQQPCCLPKPETTQPVQEPPVQPVQTEQPVKSKKKKVEIVVE